MPLPKFCRFGLSSVDRFVCTSTGIAVDEARRRSPSRSSMLYRTFAERLASRRGSVTDFSIVLSMSLPVFE